MVKIIDEGATRHSNIQSMHKIETKKAMQERNGETTDPSNGTACFMSQKRLYAYIGG
jgi:hypothetical protein